jgi:hypothetical protein
VGGVEKVGRPSCSPDRKPPTICIRERIGFPISSASVP